MLVWRCAACANVVCSMVRTGEICICERAWRCKSLSEHRDTNGRMACKVVQLSVLDVTLPSLHKSQIGSSEWRLGLSCPSAQCERTLAHRRCQKKLSRPSLKRLERLQRTRRRRGGNKKAWRMSLRSLMRSAYAWAKLLHVNFVAGDRRHESRGHFPAG